MALELLIPSPIPYQAVVKPPLKRRARAVHMAPRQSKKRSWRLRCRYCGRTRIRCDGCNTPRCSIGLPLAWFHAEADNVCLLTTLPLPMFRAMALDEQRDAEQRVWYVGVTRARRTLMVLDDPRAQYRKGLPL